MVKTLFFSSSHWITFCCSYAFILSSVSNWFKFYNINHSACYPSLLHFIRLHSLSSVFPRVTTALHSLLSTHPLIRFVTLTFDSTLMSRVRGNHKNSNPWAQTHSAQQNTSYQHKTKKIIHLLPDVGRDNTSLSILYVFTLGKAHYQISPEKTTSINQRPQTT